MWYKISHSSFNKHISSYNYSNSHQISIWMFINAGWKISIDGNFENS